MRSICVLGSTGSIGVSTLDVVSRHPQDYRIVALSANSNVDTLYDQCIVHNPDYAVVVDHKKAGILQERLNRYPGSSTKVLAGAEALEEIAALPEVDTVMAAIVGAAGLMPTLAAARGGKRILLANKEALVMSGRILLKELADHGAELLPIDSEHNAIFQCMPADYRAGERDRKVRKILLTASGGPFRTKPLDEFDWITPEQAVAHPNWDMGRKISVDSATMMNKGLELIEACLLFNMDRKDVQIVIHPQSVIHSMVDYVDGSVLAQLGNPDMRIPIAHALAWPRRFESGAEPLDLFRVQRLDFEPADEQRFPCLKLAYQAVESGGNMPTALNAANEMAVASFLDRRIRYTDIVRVVDHCLNHAARNAADSLELVLETDRQVRNLANTYISANLAN
ncbi:MAG: 1-deoxy-D-xylulose-5-phosphate reductoisomerase [Methylococcaceae bacterium]|nr:1-deoxy-D-xylulose-5-phosphate reductoisomerase [Methylococcaceae bacterium]MCI0667467.1 1-deoxy-D-xylulose-5-phosphate reductoisomerase [Methylococcaceae bacterium]MCI0732300.1 1-deoxy-D-xylulose-5-phosphate reductoisomerase [Methylococcaceae bacterium]